MSKYIIVPLCITAVIAFYWGVIVFLKKMSWSARYSVSLFSFLLFAPFFLIMLNRDGGNPGSEIVLIFPFAGAIFGYLVGLTFDLIKK